VLVPIGGVVVERMLVRRVVGVDDDEMAEKIDVAIVIILE
jgi:hypothetical protein